MRNSIAFLTAALVTSIVASIFSTQFVIAGLTSIDVDISFSTRLSMTIADFAILRTLFIAVVACLLIGFAVAAPLGARFPSGRTAWFVVAGAAALVAELLIMSSTLGLMPVAGARSAPGLCGQGIAGAIGGWCFAVMAGADRTRE